MSIICSPPEDIPSSTDVSESSAGTWRAASSDAVDDEEEEEAEAEESVDAVDAADTHREAGAEDPLVAEKYTDSPLSASLSVDTGVHEGEGEGNTSPTGESGERMGKGMMFVCVCAGSASARRLL